nr:MAG TPA: hypothetical protein [Caudoviricetes sp.]DAK05227.1 MAG TPA: hypothetical protein [Caudoviricetes sp.]DAR30795.1 MAG TPA: hypothetical protein [Caudoviricetes sp.]DAY37913.1 MAG TPA: hypothetical protein [Caudoviricetes sp.]
MQREDLYPAYGLKLPGTSFEMRPPRKGHSDVISRTLLAW